MSLVQRIVLTPSDVSAIVEAPFPLGFDVIKSQRALESGTVVTLADVAGSAEFKRLDALIVAFRLSFPKEWVQ